MKAGIYNVINLDNLSSQTILVLIDGDMKVIDNGGGFTPIQASEITKNSKWTKISREVVATQNVKQLGSQIQLTQGYEYYAIPATNQPDYQKLCLFFVYDNNHDWVLCTMGDEVIPR